MTITIYHFPQSRALRPAWLLEELGIEFNFVVKPREEAIAFAASQEYRAINPLGKFPAMVDGDITMIESVAIMEYILTTYGKGRLHPDPASPEYATYLQWLHFGESGMNTYVVTLVAQVLFFAPEQRSDFVAEWARTEVKKCLNMLARTLEKQDYLCPSGFTAADISVFYMLFLLKLVRQFGDAPEPVKAYFDRLKTRPAWQKVSAIPAEK